MKISKTLLITTIISLIAFVTTGIASAQDCSHDIFKCEYIKDSAYVKITGFNLEENEREILIPGEIDGKYVVEIGESAFLSKNLISVILPENLIRIENDAFHDNFLREINLPNTIEYIGERAFSSNRLMTVRIPYGVTSISAETFSNNKLTDAEIPDSVTVIGQSAFHTNRFTSIIIPKNIIRIEKGAFRNNELTSVRILGNLEWIGQEAFVENLLTKVELPKDTEVENRAFDEDVEILIPQSDVPSNDTEARILIGLIGVTIILLFSLFSYVFINRKKKKKS